MGDGTRADEFVALLAKHEREIATHVMVLVTDWSDAEDVLQETKMAMWREFERFESGTNFAAWGKKIAFYRVLHYRRNKKGERLRFSDEFVETVDRELQQQSAQLDRRATALARCIEQLPSEHRRVLDLRYSKAMNIDDIAKNSARTSEAVYRLLSRIRRALHDCVNLKTGVASHG